MSTIFDNQESVLNFKDKTTTNYLDISLEKIMTYLKKTEIPNNMPRSPMILSGELSYLLPKQLIGKPTLFAIYHRIIR